jgi:hypothetical protein
MTYLAVSPSINARWKQPFDRRLFGTATLLLTGFLCGCSRGETEATPQATSYQLVAVNSRSLPAAIGLIELRSGYRDSVPVNSGCSAEIDAGSLVLTPENRSFALEWAVRDSCSKTRFGATFLAGTYSQTGLSFHFQAITAGAQQTFDGSVNAGNFTISVSGLTLTFKTADH